MIFLGSGAVWGVLDQALRRIMAVAAYKVDGLQFKVQANRRARDVA